MIAVNDLTLTLQGHTILDHVTVEFASGRIHGLIGRNGSGKTMLMKCITGFVRPTSGTILIDGKSYVGSNQFPPNMGVIIETPGFIPYLTGLRNLTILADLRKKVDLDQVRKAMELVGLDPDLKRKVKKYSLGMRQRLGIAQAIMEDPALLILDEPFNGLDKDGVIEMRDYLLRLRNQGKTILIASHSAEDVAVLCDTVHEMEHGKIQEIAVQGDNERVEKTT